MNGSNLKKQAKQERGKITTQLILDAASQVLVTEGYPRASTNRLADRAGVSVGTLYHYFDNKEDIYRELLERIYARMLQSITCCPEQPTLSQLLEVYNLSLLSIFNEDPALIQSLGNLGSGPYLSQRNEWREKIVNALEAMLKPHESEITCEDLNIGARVVVCATEGIGFAANSVQFQPGDLLRQLLRVQLSYLTSPLR